MTTSARPAPFAPPDERFWQRYSPHYEFPLSGIGSFAMHVAGVMVLLGALWLLANTTLSDKTPVPMIGLTVDSGEGAGVDSGGDSRRERDEPPASERIERVAAEIQGSLPQVPVPEVGLRPQDLPGIISLTRLPDELRKSLVPPSSGSKKGSDDKSTGPAGKGGPSSPINRAIRWELNFKTEDGRDYLAQLAAMKATIVMPQPPDWKDQKAYKDLAKPKAEAFKIDALPKLFFIDDDSRSAEKLAKAMGLDFAPPSFIAFFPKEVEEQLAAKERAYLGRREEEIFSTKFKIVIRDGKPTFMVVDQVPVKK